MGRRDGTPRTATDPLRIRVVRGFFSFLRSTWRRRLRRRDAFRLLADLFRDGRRLAGTSLRRRHASRWVYFGHDEDADGRIVRIRFGILRHPRPYAFSAQAHKVIESYSYDPVGGELTREGGLNLTRRAGRDDD